MPHPSIALSDARAAIRRSARLGLGAVALLLTTLAAQAQNLLINGSFEADAVTPGTWSITPNITGWAGGPEGIELRNAFDGLAFDGVNFAELDAHVNSEMSQVLPTTAGQQYTLSFMYSPRNGIAANSNGIEVLWEGVVLATLTADGLPFGSGHQWAAHSFTVRGPDGNSATLGFRAVGLSDQHGGSLDLVALTPVPEPAAGLLLAGGLGLMAAFTRRRTSA